MELPPRGMLSAPLALEMPPVDNRELVLKITSTIVIVELLDVSDFISVGQGFPSMEISPHNSFFQLCNHTSSLIS